MTFEPVNRGMVADQLVVPFAVPDAPVLVDQVTFVTPTLSLAVPLNAMVAADVETVVPPGDPMVNVGGVVSDPPPVVTGGVGGVVDAACLVMVTTCDTCAEPADAVTVIVFTPTASAIFEIVHAAALPAAAPDTATDDDAVDQDTEIVPDPPAAAPVRVTADAVVVAAVAFTVKLNAEPVGVGAGVGVGVGAGAGVVEPVCAAYIV
jgi:hypothetical protein